MAYLAQPGQVWEVVGGAERGGVLVRIARDLTSPQEPERLSVGSLVVEVELAGERLRYNRIGGTGSGPDSGWVSVRSGRKDLLIPSDARPPKNGWKVLSKELPAWSPAPEEPEPLLALTTGGSEGSLAVRPQCSQTPGSPFVFYHQITFMDTKPTGLRMSACLAAMDECRTDLMSLCDMSVDSFRNVTDPFTQVVIELRPAIQVLGKDASNDGMLYTHPDSKGAILSWLRLEAQFGWPMFPLRNEEQHVYLVGKQRHGSQRLRLATARFTEAFVDDAAETPAMLSGEQWERDAERYWATVKRDHSSLHLAERQLHKLYPSGGAPFEPTHFRKVSWLMSHSFGDLWSLLYHAKTPELLWDVNMLAGGPFRDLVTAEPDPQAMVVSLPKKMEVGNVYDVLCFLDVASSKAAYVVLAEGKTGVTDCHLVAVARYRWQGVPEDGQTLTAEDIELCSAGTRSFVGFASGSDVKAGRLLDLGRLPRLS